MQCEDLEMPEKSEALSRSTSFIKYRCFFGLENFKPRGRCAAYFHKSHRTSLFREKSNLIKRDRLIGVFKFKRQNSHKIIITKPE